MLTYKEKFDFFEKYLSENNHNDSMIDELHLYFFELENGNFDFLNKLNSYAEIENKIKFITSKMLRHEHEDGLFNIIESYLLLIMQ